MKKSLLVLICVMLCMFAFCSGVMAANDSAIQDLPQIMDTNKSVNNGISLFSTDAESTSYLTSLGITTSGWFNYASQGLLDGKFSTTTYEYDLADDKNTSIYYMYAIIKNAPEGAEARAFIGEDSMKIDFKNAWSAYSSPAKVTIPSAGDVTIEIKVGQTVNGTWTPLKNHPVYRIHIIRPVSVGTASFSGSSGEEFPIFNGVCFASPDSGDITINFKNYCGTLSVNGKEVTGSSYTFTPKYDKNNECTVALRASKGSNENAEASYTLHKLKEGEAITGSAGDTVNWSYLNGVLTVNGTGSIPDYKNEKEMPWSAFKKQIKEVKIADTITSVGDYSFAGFSALEKVTAGTVALGERTFNECTSLKTVQASITELDWDTFHGCASLTDVTLADTLTSISSNAFYGCTSLAEIDIPDSVTVLNYRAFYGCTSLTSVEIPKGVTGIGRYVFNGCTSLVELTVTPGNTTYKAVDNVLYSIDGTTLVLYPFGLRGAFHIPEGVTTINERVFEENTQLTEIIIPQSVTSIGELCFKNCTGLTRAEILGPVTSLPNELFMYAKSMTSIVLPSTVTSIGQNAFGGTALEYIYFTGTYDQWAAISSPTKPTVGTWKELKEIVCYYGTATVNDRITTQPADAVFKQNTTAKPLTVSFTVPDGETASVNWYVANQDAARNGIKVESKMDSKTTSSCVPDTTVPGNKYYYCIIEYTDTEGNMSTATSEPATVAVTYGDVFKGDGTESSPYELATANDLAKLAELVNAGDHMTGIYFKMTENIQLPADWKPIGALKEGTDYESSGRNILPFSGAFDGANHTLTVHKGGLPLFGYVRQATVKNLNIAGEYINSNGGLVAYCAVDYGADGSSSVGVPAIPPLADFTNITIQSNTAIKGSGLIYGSESGGNTVQITNCIVKPGVKLGVNEDGTPAGNNRVGSFMGDGCGYITSSVSYADVYGNRFVGGLVGRKSAAMGPLTIRNSEFHGTVTATGNYVGGIAGGGYNSITAPNTPAVSVENCLVTGTVIGTNQVGGIFGGEDGLDQTWDNGASRIRNNVFTGTVTGTDANAYVGGIVGFMRSLNKYNLIENNYYSEGVANKGIGGVEHIDTNAVDYGTKDGIFYYDTSTDSLDDIKEIVDAEDKGTADWQYTSVCRTNHNRTDDPMGADANKLTKAVTAAELSDGTVVDLLNKDKNSLHNWVQGNTYPEISDEPIAYQLAVSGEIKTKYYIGEELDLTGAVFTATWSDGTTSDVTDKVEVSGFDSSQRALLTLTATYGAANTSFEVQILKKPTSNDITVYFTLLGDTNHGSLSDEETPHALVNKNLETWIERKAYTVDMNATVKDVLDMALKANNMTCVTTQGGNYIASITTAKGMTLAEFTNGSDSGWMYTLNDIHSNLGVKEQYLEDGDEIIFHYTDAWKIETPGGNVADHRAANKVEDQIAAIGNVTKDSEKAIKAARTAYDALTKDQKELVENYDTLVAAEKAYAELLKPTDPVDPVALPFTDIPAEWYKEAISYVYGNKIMYGMSSTTFEPNTTLSRGMFITMIHRLEGKPAVSGSYTFTDVPSDTWYTEAVVWGTQNGIIEGYSTEIFDPNGKVTREQMAAMMYRYAKHKGMDVSATADFAKFNDGNTVSDWAKEEISWAVAVELFKGDTDNNLNPTGDATRAEAATVITCFANDILK